MRNNEYIIQSESGAWGIASAHTELGAKREATRNLVFGAGDMFVVCPNGVAYVRRFWQCLDRFGWGKWEMEGGMR